LDLGNRVVSKKSVSHAPYFTTYVSPTVYAAYMAWAHHYNDCLRCSRNEWYDPDPQMLCPDGRRFYLAWNHSVMLNWFPTSARKMLSDAS